MSARRSLLAVVVVTAASCSLPTIAPEFFDGGVEGDQDGGPCNIADTFLDVSQGPGPGGSYPKASVKVTCTADRVTVATNDLPHYTFVQQTENNLTAKQIAYMFPRQPKFGEAPISLVNVGGPVGVTVAGTMLHNGNEGPEPAEFAFGDPIANGRLDECLGHVAKDGSYHVHGGREICLSTAGLVAEAWTLAEPDATRPSPVLGYAADGFLIHGPRECADASCSSIVTLQSSWEKVGDPKSYAWDAYEYRQKDSGEFLDRCNGHTGPDGKYHYHATASFPYTMGCLMGTPLQQIGGGMGPDGGMPPPMDGGMPPPMDGGMPPSMDGGMPPPMDGGMPPVKPCMGGQTSKCCGDSVCDGPETAQNCSADCP